MKNQDLKIGNWVEIIQKIKGHYTTLQKSSFSVPIEKNYKPILFDENWFERFKFKRYPYSVAGQSGWHHPTENNFSVLLNKKNYCIEYVDEDNFCHKEQFTYVHQLQNLFSHFTNKEL